MAVHLVQVQGVKFNCQSIPIHTESSFQIKKTLKGLLEMSLHKFWIFLFIKNLRHKNRVHAVKLAVYSRTRNH